ncbi:MAG: ABC transporter ATP-binding protein [Candidatus Bathyarchaeota archaeon]|nr:ABC transporter ATP-binding protein [Candidatus Bathyarchaeota archaeon]
MEAIVTKGLTKYYGNILALNELDLKIEKGRCVGFLGPNGAGKTTTIKILCNLIQPTKGEAYVNGHDAVKEPAKALRNVGAMVETPEFYSYLTPLEMLSYLGRLRGIGEADLKARIDKVLEIVKLSEWAGTRIGKFSRGMKQRLGIAQALLHDPPVMILDEPSLGLDPRGMYEIREIIKAAVKEGKTVFLASHMLREIQEVADSVALINKGKLLAYDRLEKLENFFRANKIHVQLLQPIAQGKLAKLEKLDHVKAVTAEEKCLTVSFDGNETEQARLLTSLVKDLEVPVVSFKPSLEALEEIYLQLIKEGN